MPIHKVKGGGYQWGGHGKVYPSKEQAQKQAAAAFASGWHGDAEEEEFLGAGICLITPENKALFLKKADSGKWGFPGGKRDGNETPEETARRETLEEAGALPYGEIEQGVTNDEGAEKYHTFVQHIMFEFEPILSDEHSDYVWAVLGEAPEPLIDKAKAPIEELTSFATDRGIYNEMKHYRDNDGKFASSGHHGKLPKSELKQPMAREMEKKTMFDPDAVFYHSEDLNFENLEHIHGGIYFATDDEKTKGTEVFGKQPMAEYQLKRDKLFELRRKHISDEEKEILQKVLDDVFDEAAIKKFKEDCGGAWEPMESVFRGNIMEDCGVEWQNKINEAIFSKKFNSISMSFKAGDKKGRCVVVKDIMQVKRKSAPKAKWQGAGDTAMAFDKTSIRKTDEDGRLHVQLTNISKANICPYRGCEIPNADELGLDADKIYYLLRDPKELKAAAETFNNIPLLSEHVPVSADDHKPKLVVGATGSDAVFKSPFLQNSLVVWAQDAIDDIESGEKRELSCAYRYEPDMTPGKYEGQPYDGVMRNIRGNHVALVATGRAGPDVVVGDNLRVEKYPIMRKQLSQKATAVKGALIATFATDSMPNLDSVLAGVGQDNWHAKKPSIIAALKPGMSSASDVKKLSSMLNKFDKFGMDEDLEDKKAEDADPVEGLMNFLRGKVEDADLEKVGQMVCEIMDKGEATDADPEEEEEKAEDAEEEEVEEDSAEEVEEEKEEAEDAEEVEEAEDKEEDVEQAQDNPPPFEGKPEDPAPESKGKTAMDSAMYASIKAQIKADLVKQFREVDKAKELVEPLVGRLAIAQDSAEGVYKETLKLLGVSTEGVHPSAFKTLVQMQKKSGNTAKQFASDSAIDDSFATKYGSVRKI